MVGLNCWIKAKYFFWTYPSLETLNLSKDDLLTDFWAFANGIDPKSKFVTIGIEPYPNDANRLHAHVFYEYEHSISIKSETFRYPDLPPPNYTKTTHGQSSTARVREYCSKGDTTETNYEPTEGSSSDANWAAAINAGTRQEAQELIKSKFPSRYVTNYGNIQQFLNGHFSGDNQTYTIPTGYTESFVPDSSRGEKITEWLLDDFHKVSPFDDLFNLNLPPSNYILRSRELNDPSPFVLSDLPVSERPFGQEDFENNTFIGTELDLSPTTIGFQPSSSWLTTQLGNSLNAGNNSSGPIVNSLAPRSTDR